MKEAKLIHCADLSAVCVIAYIRIKFTLAVDFDSRGQVKRFVWPKLKNSMYFNYK